MDFDSIAWTGAEGVYGDHPLLMRFREFDEAFPKASYPVRLNVLWQMFESDVNGWATDSEFEKLSIFEDRLVEAVEQDNQSILTVVLTYNSTKEFVFHSQDEAVFLDRLINMPQEAERYPITIYKNLDAEWEYFESVTTSVSEE
ncbi:MAG TPA: DUF695 domain-containing protein [Pyrinomonadaceae bacterium]|nr:DUF695 domain-containing protein [Pyrinomonadaceae bacterium]